MEITSRPIIGITVSLDDGKRISSGHEYLYIKRAYSQAVARAGGEPVLLSPDTSPVAVTRLCRGLVISGGDDIPPELYGEQAAAGLSPESQERIDWERQLLDSFSAVSLPVLGICYGMQLINVHFGGSLIQEISSGVASPLDHGGGGRKTTHEIAITERSFLHPLFGDKATVCSRHHQAIRRLAPGFRVAATAADGIVEAMEGKGMLGVEWHPEADGTGPEIYRNFVDRAVQTQAG